MGVLLGGESRGSMKFVRMLICLGYVGPFPGKVGALGESGINESVSFRQLLGHLDLSRESKSSQVSCRACD